MAIVANLEAKFQVSGAEEAVANTNTITSGLNAMGAAADNNNKKLSQLTAEMRQQAMMTRMLTPQVTDIFTSLASGQNPFTVFLQQGGQIRDQFAMMGMTGGEAVKSIAGYFTRLLTPMNLVIAATATITTGLIKGALEARNFAREIALSGQSGALSYGSIQAASRSFAEENNISIGKAIDTVGELAKRFGSVNEKVLLLASAGTKIAELSGNLPIEESKALADAFDKGVIGISQLNEKYRFLSPEIMKTVRGLIDQGETTEALRIVTNNLVESLGQRMPEAQGYIGRFLDFSINGFKSLGQSISSAWNNLKLLGAGDTNPVIAQREIDTLQQTIARSQKRVDELNARKKANENKLLPGDQKTLNFYQSGLIADRERLSELLTQQNDANIRQATEAKRLADEEIRLYNESAERKGQIQDQGLRALSSRLAREQTLRERAANQERALLIEGELTKEQFAKNEKKRIEAELQGRLKLAQAELSVAQSIEIQGTKIQDRNKEIAAKSQKVTAAEAQVQQALQAIEANRARVLDDQLKKQEEALKKREEFNQRALKDQAEALERENKDLNAIKEKIEQEKRLTDVIGLKGQALADVIAKQIEDEAISKEKKAADLDLIEPNNELSKVYREQADALRDLAKAKRDRTLKEEAENVRKETEREYEKLFDNVSQSLSDAIMSGGKSAGKMLKDYFKTLVLQPIVKTVMEPIARQVLGMIGIGGSGTAMAGQAGAAGSGAGGLAGTLNSIGSSLGMPGMAATLMGLAGTLKAGATMAMSGGTMASLQGAGSMMANGSVSSGLAQGAGTLAPWMASALIGNQIGKAISGGYSISGGTGNTAVIAGQVIGALGGPIGSIIGGGIGGLVNRAFGRKLANVGIEGTFGGDMGFQGQQFTYERGGWFRSSKTSYSAIAEDTRSALSQAFIGIRDGTAQMASALGQNVQQVKDYTTSIRISTMGLSEAQTKEAIDKKFNEIAEAMAKVALGGEQFIRFGETAAEALQRLSSSLLAVNNAFNLVGIKQLQGIGGADIASQVADAFGGISSFQSTIGNYFDNFFTAQEKLAANTRYLTQELRNVGIDRLPQTREEYRKLVEANQALIGSGNQEAIQKFATLTKLASDFAKTFAVIDVASVQKNILNINTSLTKAVDQYQMTLLSVFSGGGWFGTLAKKIGNITVNRLVKSAQQLVEDSINALAGAFGGSDALNQSFSTYIENFKTQEEKIAMTTASLTATVSELGIALPKTREDFKALVASQDLLTSNGRKVFEVLLKNQDAFNSIYTEAENKAKEAADAAKQVAEQWKGVTESLMEQAKQIRRDMVKDTAASMAMAQTEFTIATAKARAGDIEAAQKLGSLASSLIDAGASYLSSGLDFRLLQATTAASLETTAIVRNPLLDASRQTADEVTMLREDLRISQAQLAAMMNRVAKVLERWDADGQPSTRVEV
jgi:phage-related minor tail protein